MLCFSRLRLLPITGDVVVRKTWPSLRSRGPSSLTSFSHGKRTIDLVPIVSHRYIFQQYATCGNRIQNRAGRPRGIGVDVETVTVVSERTESLSVAVCLPDWLRNCMKRDTNALMADKTLVCRCFMTRERTSYLTLRSHFFSFFIQLCNKPRLLAYI